MAPPLASPAARQLWAALRMLIVMTVIVGLAYPLVMTGFAQVAFPGRADGSIVERNGTAVGSSLIGQSFTGRPEYFQSRPSAAGDGYDSLVVMSMLEAEHQARGAGERRLRLGALPLRFRGVAGCRTGRSGRSDGQRRGTPD